MGEYWLKYGFKDNGDLVCVRTLSNTMPDKRFFYTEDSSHKEVKHSNVLKLTNELINDLKISKRKIREVKDENCNKC